MTDSNHMTSRWTARKAQDWYSQQEWPVGFNFLPSTAVNFVDMWHPETFDEATIERELGWAASYGYNSTRVNLQFILWQSDRDGLINRVHRFLEISEANGFSTILCLFDDCEFSGSSPTSHRQPEPIPGIHNSRALGSPGRAVVMDKAMWPELKNYVSDIITEFRADPRVLLWDIYNEPGNASVFHDGLQSSVSAENLANFSFELCQNAFAWAREVNPEQPITSGAWRVANSQVPSDKSAPAFDNSIDQFLLEASDVISFHAYVPRGRFEKIVEELNLLGRPVFCTEWMARTAESYFEQQLPIMHDMKIAAYQWGLVTGNTQTHIPWPAFKSLADSYDEASSEWFHDVLRPDGSPYDVKEMRLLMKLTSRRSGREAN